MNTNLITICLTVVACVIVICRTVRTAYTYHEDLQHQREIERWKR